MKIYKSFDEIKSDPRFKPGNTVDMTNYKGLTGYYAFREGQEIKCCVRKPNGNPCDHIHRKGWVPLLTDGSLTVIGGDCARDKFGAESIVGRDISAAEKAIRKEEALARWRQLLGDRGAKLAALKAARDKGDHANKQLWAFQQALGDAGWLHLSYMSRTGSGVVQVRGVVDPKWDQDGVLIRDGRSTPITVGRFTHINVCQTHTAQAMFDNLKKVTQAYQVTEEAVAQMRNREPDTLLATLEEYSRSLEAVNQFEASVKAFLSNNFTLLAFLTNDKSERVRLTRFGLEHAGKPTGRQPAKAYLQDWESRLKAQHKVERLQIH